MPELAHALGCLKDPEDPRDFPLTRIPPALKVKLPPRIDYSKKMSPVSDQGDELRTSCWNSARLVGRAFVPELGLRAKFVRCVRS
jgi:hypothetical protein